MANITKSENRSIEANRTTPCGVPYDIEKRLQPARVTEVAPEINRLSTAFRVNLEDGVTATYYQAISGEPIWAVRKAVTEFTTGRAPERYSKRFMPTPAEFGARVREIVEPHRENAKPRYAEPREPRFEKPRDVDGRAAFAAKILARHGMDKPRDNEDPALVEGRRQAFEAVAAPVGLSSIGGIPISDKLAAKLKEWSEGQ